MTDGLYCPLMDNLIKASLFFFNHSEVVVVVVCGFQITVGRAAKESVSSSASSASIEAAANPAEVYGHTRSPWTRDNTSQESTYIYIYAYTHTHVFMRC